MIYFDSSQIIVLSQHIYVSLKSLVTMLSLYLDFIGLEDSLKIGVGHDGSWHAESLLVCRAVDGVKSIESSSSPNAETSNVSTGGKFEQIEFVDGEEGDAGDVAESKRDTLILLVNN